jgi:acetylornithine deacetylase
MTAPTDILLEWLAIDSTTDREAEFLETLQAHFSAKGWSCRRQEVLANRWNLLVVGDEPPRFLYSTHVDTVPPHLQPRREDGVIYGRGACDTKGGIVAMSAAGDRLREDGLHEFGYLFVVGEEVDHVGARTARALDVQTDRIILCEPTRNRVVSAQKGMLKLEIRAEGIAAHSAYPERGVSAVHRLLAALEALRNERWPTDETLGPTTINVGVIEGGVAANVFAPSARAEVLFRTVSETEPLLRRVRDLCGPDVTIEVPAANDPVRFDPPDGVETCTVAFNTDATYLGEIAPIWLVGPGDIEVAHSDDEHITVESLHAGIDLYEHLGRLALER